MASKQQQMKQRTLEQVVADIGLYPLDAFDFVQQGLTYTMQQVHGEAKDALPTEGDVLAAADQSPIASRHVSGRQLCEGIREFALAQWGLLARAVLRRWNVTSTYDFGRIVFALIDAGHMQKNDDDSVEDFRDVFDFRSGLESSYRIQLARASSV